MRNIDTLLNWMINGVPGAKTSIDVVGRMCPDLISAGVPLDRCQALVLTLHPHIAGRSFTWLPGQGVQVGEHPYSEVHRPEAQTFSYIPVFRKGAIVRRRLSGGPLPPDLEELASEGYTDFFAGPLKFLSGQNHGIFFATKNRSGFDDDDIDALTRLLAPLSRIAEILALARTAVNLLNTYVGHDAGERILAGQIKRGETRSIHAVIWFSDLRGFTTMSSKIQPTEVIAILNDMFDCQVPVIERHGGQVLKFMGDGMLAIFPCQPENSKPTAASASAAAQESFQALDKLNAQRVEDGQAEIKFGVALHIGEVAYGNIGGSNRLDFTCIGSAVNLTARLENITGQMDENIVFSEEIAKLINEPLKLLGEFNLKGMAKSVKVFSELRVPVSA